MPVGLTRFREGLAPLKAFDKERAGKVVAQIYGWQERLLKEHQSRIVYLADELYILAEQELPPFDAYEDFPQIENGVGMVASFAYEVDEALAELRPQKRTAGKTVSIATGVSVYQHMKDIAGRIEKETGIKILLYPVENDFFGRGVTVTGLLTGSDLLRELKGKELGERLLLSKNMFKAGTATMLDDITAGRLEKELGVEIQIVDNSGQAFVDTLVQI